MLNVFRRFSKPLATFVCMVLLTIWITGVHGHRQDASHGDHHPLTDGAFDDGSAEHPAAHGHYLDTHDPAHDSHSDSPLLHAGFLHLGDGHHDIELPGLSTTKFNPASDLSAALILAIALLFLSSPRTIIFPRLPRTPFTRRRGWSLSPPLRGPPLISFA